MTSIVWFPYKSKEGQTGRAVDVQSLLESMEHTERTEGPDAKNSNWWNLKKMLNGINEEEVAVAQNEKAEEEPQSQV